MMMIKRTLRAALSKIGNALLKTPQAGPRTAQSSALNYASVNVLDPSVLARAFTAADQGEITQQAALFELIEEQDAHIFGELSKRRRSVTGLGWQLAAPDDASQSEIDRAEELADLLRAIPNFEDAQYDLTDAIGKGFAALEINWTPGELWLPRPDGEGRAALEWVPQRMFRIENFCSGIGELRYLKDGIPVPLTPGRWLIHEHRAKSGYLEASALFRVLAWTYAYKAYNVRDMQRFLELYGLPLRLGKYPAGIGDKDRDALLRAVRGIGHDGAGVIPHTMQIEFAQAMKTGTVTDFLSAIEYWEKKQSIAILGGTLTSQADGKTSTNALGAIHDKIRREIMLHDVRQIEPSLNAQLVKPIAVINGLFPEGRVPTFYYQTEETVDQDKMVAVLEKAAQVGLEIDVEWAHKVMQIPRAAEGAKILRLAAGASPFADNPDEAPEQADLRQNLVALSRQPGNADAAALAADRLIGDTAPEIEAWLETIEAMLDAATSLEEFREMLLAAWPELPTDKLEEAMTEASIAMDLRGQAEVREEIGNEIEGA
jgi:phage gp29-like protein